MLNSAYHKVMAIIEGSHTVQSTRIDEEKARLFQLSRLSRKALMDKVGGPDIRMARDSLFLLSCASVPRFGDFLMSVAVDRHLDKSIRREAANYLSRVRNWPKNYIVALTKIITDKSGWADSIAKIYLLKKLRFVEAEAFRPVLASIISDSLEDPDVRVCAAEVVQWSTFYYDNDIEVALIVALRDRSELLRLWVAKALKHSSSAEVLSELQQFLTDRSEEGLELGIAENVALVVAKIASRIKRKASSAKP